MKRFVWLLVAAVLLLSGCGNKEEKYTAYCEQGTASLSQQEYEQALEAFGKAADLLPDRPEAYQGRAEVYLAMAEAAEEGSEEQTSAYASALAEYEAAIQRDSGNAELYQKAIELCRQMGEEDKLLALLQSGAEATGDRTLKEALETERSRQAAAEVLSAMPYYGDISKCRMTADQAVLLGLLIAHGLQGDIEPFSGYSQPVDQVVFWNDPYTVQGYDGYYETDRSLMVLGDFSGEGLPYLYCFSSLADNSFEIYGWDEYGKPVRIIGEEAYNGRQEGYLFETENGKVKMCESGSSGADSHSRSVYTFLQGRVEESESYLEEYSYELEEWKIIENGEVNYYTEEEWANRDVEEPVEEEKAERNLPYRSFEEVVACACSPSEMIQYLNQYQAALTDGDASQGAYAAEHTEEEYMAKDMYNIMMELDQMGTLSDISDPEMPWGLTLDYARLLDMNGDGMKELILVSQNDTSYTNAFLVQWADGQIQANWLGTGLDAAVSLVREKSSGEYALQMVEYQGLQQHTCTFADRTDSFSMGIGPGDESSQEEYDRLYAAYEANCARYEVIEDILNGDSQVEESLEELRAMMTGGN